MTNKQLLFELLRDNEEARRTRSINKVFEYMFRKLGAITATGLWDYEAYIKNVDIQGIDRELRRVKQENGWQDDKAREREEAHREENRPQYGIPIESVVNQSVEDIEADELIARARAKDPTLSGRDLSLAVAEERKLMKRQ
jgi:hypothetical protein